MRVLFWVDKEEENALLGKKVVLEIGLYEFFSLQEYFKMASEQKSKEVPFDTNVERIAEKILNVNTEDL